MNRFKAEYTFQLLTVTETHGTDVKQQTSGQSREIKTQKDTTDRQTKLTDNLKIKMKSKYKCMYLHVMNIPCKTSLENKAIHVYNYGSV